MKSNQLALVFEDRLDAMDQFKKVLMATGYTVKLARSMHYAQKIWKEYGQQAKVVVFDHQLTDGNTEQLARTVRRDRPDLLMIAASAFEVLNDSLYGEDACNKRIEDKDPEALRAIIEQYQVGATF